MVAATSNMVQWERLEDLSGDSSHLVSTLAGEYAGQENTCTQRDSFFFRVSEPPAGHSVCHHNLSKASQLNSIISYQEEENL